MLYNLPLSCIMKILKVILYSGGIFAMTNEEFQHVLLSELKELRRDSNERFDKIEQRLDRVELRLDGVEQRLDAMDQRFDGIELRLDKVEQRLDKVEHKLDVVFEQTAGPVEFRADVTQKLNKLIEDQKSIMQVLGEHNVSIRTLQRRSI